VYRTLQVGPLGVKVPFAEAVRLAVKYGFAGIAVGSAEIQEAGGLAPARQLLAANHLIPVTGIPVNFRGDDATFEQGLAALPAFAETMASLGCTRVITWIMPFHETLPYAANFAQLRDRTARIAEALQPFGLRYGLEFVGPETLRAGKAHPFIYNLDGMLELIRAAGTPNLGILLDVFHWYTSGGTPADLAKLSDALVVLVHVNDAAAGVPREKQIDNQRAMPGETGVVDIATFMRALDKMGYTGPVIVEPFCAWLRALPPEEAVAATAQSLDKIWSIAGL
jgi:sugar phosphate isomerase/epimerase